MSEENTSNSLIEQLQKGKKVHDEFRKKFKDKYTIGGKTIDEWKEHFKAHIPPDLNPQTCKQLDLNLMRLHQEASFLKAEVDARLAAYKSANADRYRTEYAGLVTQFREEGKKLPATATLAALAEHSIGDIKNAMVHAEIELSFWKEILSDLRNTRKLIENITFNMNIEARVVQYQNYIDNNLTDTIYND